MVLTSSSVLFPSPLQVDEIYHDESLGVHINIVLVRMIMVGYRQVNTVLGCDEEEMPFGLAPAFRPLSQLEPCPVKEGGLLKCNVGQHACSDIVA